MIFMNIGTCGVGKSTFINNLYRKILAREGKESACTTETKIYKYKRNPICIYDIPGIEDDQNEKINLYFLLIFSISLRLDCVVSSITDNFSLFDP